MENCSFLSDIEIDEVIDAEIACFIVVVKTSNLKNKMLLQIRVNLVIMSSNHLSCFVLFICVILH